MVPVRIFNPSGEPVEIKQDSVIGQAESVSIVQTISNKEAIWLYAELFLGHHDGSCHGLW